MVPPNLVLSRARPAEQRERYQQPSNYPAWGFVYDKVFRQSPIHVQSIWSDRGIIRLNHPPKAAAGAAVFLACAKIITPGLCDQRTGRPRWWWSSELPGLDDSEKDGPKPISQWFLGL